MKNLQAVFFCIVLLLLAAGCIVQSQPVQSPLPSQPTAKTSRAPSAKEFNLVKTVTWGTPPADLPVPDTSKFTDCQYASDMFNCLIDVKYNDVVEFYQKEMKSNGWRLDKEVSGAHTSLAYKNEVRTVQIEVSLLDEAQPTRLEVYWSR